MAGGSENPDSKRNFILQQGLDTPVQESCPVRFSALMFQPRLVGSVILLAVIFQSSAIFLILSGILWWNVLVPRMNPFDGVYNRTLAQRPGAVRLDPAPSPRRFAQGMAGSFALAIGVLLLLQRGTAALVLQVLLLTALSALIFGRFCLGSFLYHLLRGRSAFAIGTLPWKGERHCPPHPPYSTSNKI
jgi:Domain of unknown function (DUF4395)